MRAAIVPLFALTALWAALPAATPAHADPYRWCAIYGGMFGATNCYFLTIEQCRAAISGNGGFCNPNTFYDGRPVGSPDGPVRRRRHAAR
jgi:hypothetical protein